MQRLEESWGKKTRELREEKNESEENLEKERLNCERLRQQLLQQETTISELEDEVKRLGCVRELEDELQILSGKLQDARLSRQVRFLLSMSCLVGNRSPFLPVEA